VAKCGYIVILLALITMLKILQEEAFPALPMLLALPMPLSIPSTTDVPSESKA
jgi:hypothetical protein